MSTPTPELRSRITGGTAAPEGTSVEADLGWALGVVFRRYAKSAAEALDDVPGGPRGYQVLATATVEGPKRQLDLAGQLGIDRTVMTYLLDDLEKADLVQRQPDPADRRARLIVPTEQGRDTLCDLEARLQAAEDEVLGSLDDSERGMFRALLQRVALRANTVEKLTNVCDVADDLTDSDC